jgi:hypothetical protein
VNSYQVTVYGTGGPNISLLTGNGVVATVNGGWQYVYAYGNSSIINGTSTGHISNPTQASSSTGNFGGFGYVNTSGTAVTAITGTFVQGTTWNGRTIIINGTSYTVSSVTSSTTLVLTGSAGTQTDVYYTVGYAGVQVDLTASTDPQVNQIHVYRTKDGGSVYYELPSSPCPNTTQNITDNNPDSTLNSELFWPSVPYVLNTPPPTGLVNLTFHLGRIWGSAGNIVYYSADGDVALGNGNESFPPANYFQFPSVVNRLVPYSSGLLVFTADDVWIILGTSVATFYTYIFQQGVGLLSYNALDIQGSNIFMLTSDGQGLSLSSSGINEIGYAIGDKLAANFNPATAYVASIISGTAEKAVYFSDGVSTWYRCNWNQPPEGGPAWSPLAQIGGGCAALTSIETFPGVHQLLMAYSNGGVSYVLFRDPTVYQDIATAGPYPSCYLTLGSLVLAQPGQIAEVESVILELINVGSVPSVGIRTDEIGGSFESLPVPVNDPPDLTPSTTVMSNRWYLAQGINAARLRHMQIQITYGAADVVRNELLTMSVYGSLIHQD